MLLSLFTHLYFKVAPCSSCSESPILCFKVAPCSSCSEFHKVVLFILVGIFHYRTWLVYSYNGLPQMSQVFVSKQVGCTPTSFILLSIHSSSASIAWQSLLLMLTSIDGHLHSPLISRVDVRVIPFCLLHITSTIIFYSTHSAMSMACAHVLREG